MHEEDVATKTKKGIVKVGNNISVTNDGTISVNYPVTSVNSKDGNVILNASDVGAVSKSGDTMSGTLTVGSAEIQTNGYVIGTWLKTTANTDLSSTSDKIAVINNGWIYSRTPAQIKSDIGLGSVANERQYSSSNPPPYPVTSVNGKTGAVSISSGVDVVVSKNEPSGLKSGDFWYQIV